MVTEWPFVRAHTWDRRIGSGCLRLALGADKIVRLLVASLSSMPGGTQICNPVVSLCFGALKLIL